VHITAALPYRDDLSVAFDAYADHVRWLAENGTHGVTPNGSLGEYQVLTTEERAKAVEVAVSPSEGPLPFSSEGA
jgi:4-hydroxy-tetrahydrodipicolinate synthase